MTDRTIQRIALNGRIDSSNGSGENVLSVNEKYIMKEYNEKNS